jgi:multiple sugar transport system permease protein
MRVRLGKRQRKIVWIGFTIIIVSLVLIFWFCPIVWMVISSIKPNDLIMQQKLILFFKPTLQNYEVIFFRQNFMRYFLNSLVVAVGVTLISIIAGYFAAYSLARFQTGGKHFASWVLSARAMPPIVLSIPFFILFSKLGLSNTWYALMIVYTVFNLPLVVWLMRDFIRGVPEELEEAARVDGATRLASIFRIVLPLTRPGLVAVTILSVIFSWNEFLFASFLTIIPQAKTLPVGASDFIAGYLTVWGAMFASSTFTAAPIIFFSLLAQKHLVRGMTLGAMK